VHSESGRHGRHLLDHAFDAGFVCSICAKVEVRLPIREYCAGLRTMVRKAGSGDP
jgi:hypothetical protein